LDLYKKALELDPERPSLHWYIAGVYWKLDNHKKALEHLEKCRNLMPQIPEELNEVDDFIG
jgi:tetratricopeptide (TPR) repeat protein